MSEHAEMDPAILQAAGSIRKAAEAKKCWSCGCLHSSLKAIRDAMARLSLPSELVAAMSDAENRLAAVSYDCLGCQECYPAEAVNALGIEGDACTAKDVERRLEWPPLPGSYSALRYKAPVAVCTLTDSELHAKVQNAAGSEVAIVGTLQTENLGIERLIENTITNPKIRFLIVCGADSRQQVGHLPGQSLIALAQSGLNEQGRIVGAKGKRPVIRNLTPGMVEHFRRTVEVVDRIGEDNSQTVLSLCRSLADRDPGTAIPFEIKRWVTPVSGCLPERMVSDPAGYFVIYADQTRCLLLLEHYDNDGVLDAVIKGKTAAEVYAPAIEMKLVSRLDHAAYLGCELARAVECLVTSRPYVQDGAPVCAPAKSCNCQAAADTGGPSSCCG